MLDGSRSAAHPVEASYRVRGFLDLPMFLVAVLFTLLAFAQSSGKAKGTWHEPLLIMQWLLWGVFVCEFAARLALASRKRQYLRHNWLDLLIVLVPFLGLLRIVTALFPLLRFALIREWNVHPYARILKQRKVGKLLLVSILVILIAATLEFLFEVGAPGSTMHSYGDALWWAAATTTTVSNQLYPVTPGGEVVAFGLMLYALGVFSYLTSSLASALIGGDAQQAAATGQASGDGAQQARLDASTLSADEIAVLRSILDKAEASKGRQGTS